MKLGQLTSINVADRRCRYIENRTQFPRDHGMNRLGLTLLAAVIITACHTASAHAELAAARQAELLYLLKHDCGSCHGMRLEGGLGPALTPRRLRPYSAETLGSTILHGRPGTPMPPWRPFLSREEALWLASRLKQGIRP